MSRLAIYNEQGNLISAVESSHSEISLQLQGVGVRFERWQANTPLADDAGQEEVLEAYRDDVARLTDEYGFNSVDVVSLRPDHPEREAFRQKFLSEHTHSDFEVRFFVDGSGLFYLHVADKVYLVLCEQGDLISVPAGTTHWFDMGERPDFKCIRLFIEKEGWVGNFTESGIAAHFPSYDEFLKVGE